MPRPRLPSNVLQLRGSFQKDPKRKRQDAQGAGPVNLEPPAHLPGNVIPAWQWVCPRLPQISITSSDEIAIECVARLLAEMWDSRRVDTKLMSELQRWLIQLGMTPAARTKIPASKPPAEQNPFASIGKGDKP